MELGGTEIPKHRRDEVVPVFRDLSGAARNGDPETRANRGELELLSVSVQFSGSGCPSGGRHRAGLSHWVVKGCSRERRGKPSLDNRKAKNLAQAPGHGLAYADFGVSGFPLLVCGVSGFPLRSNPETPGATNIAVSAEKRKAERTDV